MLPVNALVIYLAATIFFRVDLSPKATAVACVGGDSFVTNGRWRVYHYAWFVSPTDRPPPPSKAPPPHPQPTDSQTYNEHKLMSFRLVKYVEIEMLAANSYLYRRPTIHKIVQQWPDTPYCTIFSCIYVVWYCAFSLNVILNICYSRPKSRRSTRMHWRCVTEREVDTKMEINRFSRLSTLVECIRYKGNSNALNYVFTAIDIACYVG